MTAHAERPLPSPTPRALEGAARAAGDRVAIVPVVEVSDASAGGLEGETVPVGRLPFWLIPVSVVVCRDDGTELVAIPREGPMRAERQADEPNHGPSIRWASDAYREAISLAVLDVQLVGATAEVAVFAARITELDDAGRHSHAGPVAAPDDMTGETLGVGALTVASRTQLGTLRICGDGTTFVPS